jgi:hypothetical protein
VGHCWTFSTFPSNVSSLICREVAMSAGSSPTVLDGVSILLRLLQQCRNSLVAALHETTFRRQIDRLPSSRVSLLSRLCEATSRVRLSIYFNYTTLIPQPSNQMERTSLAVAVLRTPYGILLPSPRLAAWSDLCQKRQLPVPGDCNPTFRVLINRPKLYNIVKLSCRLFVT